MDLILKSLSNQIISHVLVVTRQDVMISADSDIFPVTIFGVYTDLESARAAVLLHFDPVDKQNPIEYYEEKHTSDLGVHVIVYQKIKSPKHNSDIKIVMKIEKWPFCSSNEYIQSHPMWTRASVPADDKKNG